MADEKKAQKNDGGKGADSGLGSTLPDAGVAEQKVREQEGEAPEAPNYADPEKESSTKPGTKALARQRLFEKLQGEQGSEGEGRRMGMSKARKEAYAEFEAAGNK